MLDKNESEVSWTRDPVTLQRDGNVPFYELQKFNCWGGQVQEGAQNEMEKVNMRTSEELYGCIRTEKVAQKMDKH
jgi:hypothetical protein